MAFTLMTAQELTDNGINTQKDADLDLENGVFSKPGWTFEDEFIATDGTQFRREYVTATSVPIQTIFLISNKVAVTGGNEFTKYEFYKET